MQLSAVFSTTSRLEGRPIMTWKSLLEWRVGGVSIDNGVKLRAVFPQLRPGPMLSKDHELLGMKIECKYSKNSYGISGEFRC